MVFSNTAVPKYYKEFKRKVLAGELPVNEEISLEMNRIDDLVRNRNIYYDDGPVEGFIRFCENELTLTDGSKMNMTDSFKLWGEQVYGWYFYEKRSIYVPNVDGHSGRYITRLVKKRLVNKQFIILGRGGAKTMYDECIQAYGLIVDTSTTSQITVAPTMAQAEEVLTPFRTAITRCPGPLFKFMTKGSIQNTTGSKANRPKLYSSKKGIENSLTNSLLEIKPLSINKLQGYRCKYATIDEWLSGDLREDPIGAIEQGASKIDDYLIIATSSEGTVRNGSGDDIKIELRKILKGDYYAPHVSIFWYKLDAIEEVSKPDFWIKANPNLGVTVSYETYQREVERAEQVPAARNDILAKRFGIPMEGFTYFFTYAETIKHNKREYWKMSCSLGIDLSQGDDFCSFSFLFPLSTGGFGIRTKNYITSLTLAKLPTSMRIKYESFIKEGSLIIQDRTVLNTNEIYDDVWDYIVSNDYDVRCVGYDPYNAKEFIERWTSENGPYGVEKVPQGSKTETVPLGELKIYAEQRQLFFDEDIMSFSLGNCITIEDNNGNRKLQKKRRDAKIDPVAATMDAYIAYKANADAFE